MMERLTCTRCCGRGGGGGNLLKKGIKSFNGGNRGKGADKTGREKGPPRGGGDNGNSAGEKKHFVRGEDTRGGIAGGKKEKST